jgi:hypothetical protein
MHALARKVAGLVAIMAFLGVASVAVAQNPMASPSLAIATGKVTQVDPQAKILRLQTGLLLRDFGVDEKTEISDGSNDLELQDLKPGAEVTIHYTEERGKRMSRSITVEEAMSQQGSPFKPNPAQSPAPNPAPLTTQ